ncbi:NAD(P)H-hydrate dehydratase [Ruegeria arenilitoris]|uniref:NAD(P)H-hydrate dehydratase n=1 Tax=Ruegeria arenilitoris TaxID=1173585 RepID=UPI001480EEE6|nr:NAD(P)H-hydrate dehydratase [Ruegeria arenilitoris]
MIELLTAGQMRTIEQTAIASGQVSGLELMERAGQGVVDAIFEKWPDLKQVPTLLASEVTGPDHLSSSRAVVLSGPGNNGGDGFVVARILRQLGWDVDVYLFGDPRKLPPDARTNYDRWTEDGAVTNVTEFSATIPTDAPTLILDALFGTGLVRPIDGLLADVVACIDNQRNQSKSRVVAIDIPSGLCSDSGKALGACVTADLTISFHRGKRGHYLERGPSRSGCLVVKGIGLDTQGQAPFENTASLLVRAPAGDLGKGVDLNKYSFGHALVLSGGPGKTGAARLAARGALRIGAGLVTLATPLAAQTEVAAQITSIMLSSVEGGSDLSDTLLDKRLNSLCLGPGMGIQRANDLVPIALAAKRATVLDADAITAFVENPSNLFKQLHERCVLTPHGGEFARLFPDIAEKLAAKPVSGPAYSKVDATCEAAKRAGCVVLFKGPDTVIAAPDGRSAVNSAHYERSVPWLATAGSGDVLAGFIAGLLARGFEPLKAAETAAWMHVECARLFGPGLIAEDLPEHLPKVFQHLSS